ncbi:hypothetical protein Mame_02623 [Martelella mediterranea DSM 17316]|uniref:Response receiver domain-containing protein n=2 Tax=Martelella mediterranea TaxID=293089 RepID=A0A1U9Z2M5_9HYPH|nr:hypothetical protein Mame_02623 [Martelella mediterranea DSM 17316]
MRNFSEFQLEATKQFAHTLIVVDDEAAADLDEPVKSAAKIKKPSRRDLAKPVAVTPSKSTDLKHPLRADVLVETSMSLGLICSVVKPKPNDGAPERVAKASQKADILCVDWEMHRDNGKTAVDIITRVIASDEANGGRFRLIAIYTGVADKVRILNSVLKSIPKTTRDRKCLAIRENYIESADGLRIVWLFKQGGTFPANMAEFAIPESALPSRLQKEFSLLSRGVLTNVAIATIASIRAATHHVISKFGKEMDGPYFQHRSTIRSPEDAEEYATAIILSELKNAIDRSSIAAKFAGAEALDKALDDLPADVELGDGNNFSTIDRSLYKKLIIDGIKPTLKTNQPLQNKGAKFFTEHLAQPLRADEDGRKLDLLKFAALTGLSADAEAPYAYHKPSLSLGTLVQDASGNYYLCVQASCDSVRVIAPQPFLFAKLEVVPEESISSHKDKIEFVVPRKNKGIGKSFVCLKLSDKAPYAALISIVFPPTEDEKVVAKKARDGTLYFEAATLPIGKRAEKHKRYLWIADVKRKRALRTVQFIGQEMGRIGFDEFEAFRRKYR